jgi:hypothetical protein
MDRDPLAVSARLFGATRFGGRSTAPFKFEVIGADEPRTFVQFAEKKELPCQ